MKSTDASKTEERRLLTILFADLSGFTALSSKLDPEDVCAVANTCFEYFNNVIIKHGGTIHKYGGDLVIALFGFPLSLEDNPERSIKASLEMMTLIPKVNEALSSKLKRKTDLGLHIGVNSGVVVVGEIGSPEKKEHTIMGDVVNLASRLKDVAERGEILVSEPVFRASRYLFEYEVLPPVSVKGIEDPIKIFKPQGVKEKPEPKRGLRGLYSPLVGRDKEFSLLKKIVTNLEGGEGGAVFILGEAGLGKTRLLAELKKSITVPTSPITILEGRCVGYSETMPYWPFLQILETIFEITEQDSNTIIQKKFLKKTKEIFSDTWQDVVPYIGYLFSVRFADELDEKVKYLDAEDLKIQIFVTIRRLLSALSRMRPLMLVIEDYHWIDTTSLEFLQFLFDVPEVPPILCLVLSRVEKEKEAYKIKRLLKKKLGDNFHEVILKPLDTSTVSQLIYNLLKIPGIPENFKDKILTKAEGNPFYVEEIIKSLIDSHVLIFQSGVWNLKADVSTLEIPDTVQAVIAARLDRLECDVRNVLQMASVIGRNFYGRILEHICEIDSLLLTLYLATLEDYEYIDTLRQKPEVEYIFRHPLLHEVTYNGLLKKKRSELHRKTGEAIEQIYKSRLEDFAELLAHQYVNSDDFEKALEWTKKAGHKAKDRYANDEAIQYFQKLISIIKETTGDRENELCVTCEALGDIYNLQGKYELAARWFEAMYNHAGGDIIVQSRSRRKVAEICQKQSRYDDALNILTRIEKTLPSDSEEEMVEKAEIYRARCINYGLKGDMVKAIKEGESALSIVEAGLPKTPLKIDEKRIHELRGKIFNSLAGLFYYKGEYDKAIEVIQKHIKLSEKTGNKRAIGAASGNLGLMYLSKGEYDGAIEFLQRHLAVSEQIGEQLGVASSSGNLGLVYYAKGEYDTAIEYLRRYLKIAEEIGDRRSIGQASGNLGRVYHYKGEYEKARELYYTYLKTSQEIGDKRSVGIVSVDLGFLNTETGELDKAAEYLLQAETILKEVGDKSTLIAAYTRLGELKNAETNLKGLSIKVKGALEYVARALELAEELDSQPDRATCYLVYGKLYTTALDFENAEENFKKAIEMFDELKIRKSLADAYLEYAQMLKKGAVEGKYSRALAEQYFSRARDMYEDMKLTHKIKECTDGSNLNI